ncbi:glycoside hydrolase family 2 protein [Chryseobacterium sp. Ch-15]|uniref:Beta-mannosidase B n=1 Tax=Chryseobacterium muglaense TaxID=2893752 RepID=A0A9Q3YR87_9FLAO|nr:glycoside hydrolase family 2 protein [Chryseobacterium muglaense]MBD3905335.1 glycoside hydrolase family 2 protein [Chryseobacterium muglaense]MCC9033908.1 glycoside hydrolase family 2 protein [Chryseobacterium muglaense]MCM2554127.1 glycoside hydrolase family 2 protein [Chryseobacterium muglaense]
MNKTILLALLFIQILINAQFSERNLSSEKWQFKNSKENKWLTASVPGTVHLDLMENKLIPDPYKDENEKKVQWIENENWDYQTVFKISAKELENQNADLVFYGLDTFSEIYLNGKLLKKTDNMFRTWKIPVKDDLKIGNNILQLKFKSSVNIGKDLAKKVPFTMPESPRSFVRKAQYQFGWDWGPRLVTAGIWKDVKLNFWNQAKIENIKIEQKALTNQRADLNIYAEIYAEKEGKYVFDTDNENHDIALRKGLNKISVPFKIENPKLWQPNGWGKAMIYALKFSLKKNSETIDTKEERIGLRTVELIQEKDEKGKSFYFKVNGNPMYAKGTNWIPSDSFTPRITKEKYKKLIKDCKDANMNMIRVWGGGIYEDDEFYKACDENGILVWQDFMFAGSFYPSDETFLNNVKEEVKDQVNRLQNHPSIALWCGNNEIDEAIVNWGYQKQFKYSKEDSLQVWKDYKKVFHEVIPSAINEFATKDKSIYWESSPSIGWGHKESLTEGDSHYWGVWWGEFPFEIYNEKVPRFASEYGFQGMPSLEAVKSMFSGKSDLSLENPTIKAHEKNARGFEIIQKYMERDYVVPKDFVKYNYVSQLLQARGMQIAVEAHRRAKPYNMGTLYWQLNDCWPVISWSSIDYLGNWKALHYQVKRSFENQVVLTEDEGDFLNFYAVNDELIKFEEVKLEIKVLQFDGKVINDLTTVLGGKILVETLRFNHIEIKNLIKYSNKNEVFLKLTLKDKDKKIIAQNNHFFVKPKDLKLAKPNIKIKKISATEIEISTDILAKDVYLMGDTHFSDNFFDLLPKTSRKITLSKPLKNVEVMTLWDTMNEQK